MDCPICFTERNELRELEISEEPHGCFCDGGPQKLDVQPPQTIAECEINAIDHLFEVLFDKEGNIRGLLNISENAEYKGKFFTAICD